MKKYCGLILLTVLLTYSALISVQGRTLVGYTQLANIKNLVDAQVMVQDQNGFIWFGNFTGLHRYNGYETKSFTFDSDNSNSLSTNRITALATSPDKTLWIGTFSGLNHYNPQDQSITHITSTQFPQLNSMRINDIMLDTDGILWLATAKSGVMRYHPKTNQLMPLALPPLTNTNDSEEYWTIRQQRNGNIWIGSNHGLLNIQFNNQTQQSNVVKRYTPDNSQLTNPLVFKLHIDNDDNVWIGTVGGLNYYHHRSRKLTHFSQLANPIYELADHTISSFNQDNNNLWISTWGGGVHQLSIEDQRQINAQQGFNDTYSLKLNNLKNLNGLDTSFDINLTLTTFTDSFNTLWLLSNQTVLKLPLAALKVGKINFVPSLLPPTVDAQKTITRKNDNISLQTPLIDVMIQDDAGNQWYSSEQGLMRYHPQNKTVRYFTHDKNNPNSLPKSITDIFQDDQQRIWLATAKGLVRYNLSNQDFTLVLPSETQPSQSRSKDTTSISTMTQDNNGKLWLTHQNGLIKFTPETNHFIHYKFNDNNKLWLQSRLVNKIHFDGKDTLWLAHLSAGLSLFNINTLTFSSFKPTNNKLVNLQEINDIYQQGDTIWLATGTGLARVTPDHQVKIFRDKTHGSIRYATINKGSDNTLWIGSTNGMKSFHIDSQQFNQYTKAQGFGNDSYRLRLSFKTPAGLLYFAGNKGIEFFQPKDIKPLENPNRIVIDNFLLANRAVPIKNQQHNRTEYTLQRAIEHSKSIYLTQKQNIFTFEFTALTTTEPQHIRYAYRLKGFDDNWIETQADNRKATFTNIPYGQYQFEVKARRQVGQWSPVEHLTLVVLTPWWRTYFALIVYLILSIVFIWIVYRLRAASIIARSQILEKQVKERTTTISKLMAQKDRMFANISHEFRTPLTLILNPAEKLIDNTETDRQQITKSAKSIKQNAQRLLRMVEQLLEFSKTESNHQQASLQNYSLKHTLNYLNACFDSLFSSKNLKVTISDFSDVNLTLKPDSLEIILTNLISNAVKYTPNNGHIHISVELPDGCKGKQVIIKIKDNGIGIAPKYHALVFERFGRVEHHQSENQLTTQDHTQAGTGIGLALVKELINANGGHIKLTSAPKQGSCFTITLPIDQHKNQLTENTNETSNNSKHITALEISNLTNIQNITVADSPVITTNENSNENLSENQDNKPLILVIDDNLELLELIHNIISPHFNCLLAHNGEQGIKKAQEHLPDLVISDLMMPIMDGFDVLKTLKSDDLTAHIPVIMLTAKGDAQSRIEGWNNQVDEYLAKPFNDQELIARIRNLLAIKQLISQRFAQQFAQNKQDETPNIEKQSNDKIETVATAFSQQLESILANHYHSEQLTVATIAGEMAMSQRQLIRKTKNILDMTPNECIRTFRLNKATEHLKQGMAPSTIAFKVGFSSHSYFAACFKAKFGCTPSEYKY